MSDTKCELCGKDSKPTAIIGTEICDDCLYAEMVSKRRIVACVNACAGIPTDELEDVAGWEDCNVIRLDHLAQSARRQSVAIKDRMNGHGDS